MKPHSPFRSEAMKHIANMLLGEPHLYTFIKIPNLNTHSRATSGSNQNTHLTLPGGYFFTYIILFYFIIYVKVLSYFYIKYEIKHMGDLNI